MKTLLEGNESSRHVRERLVIIIINIASSTSKSMHYVGVFMQHCK